MKTLIWSSLLSSLLTACGLAGQKGKIEHEIQGEWNYVHPTEGPLLASILDWTFKGNSFTVTGYPPLKQEGKYKILEVKGDTITLLLYNQQGDWGNSDRESLIVKQKASNTLYIDRQGPFHKKQEE